MEHLYGMGESSASFNRSLNVGKDTMMAAAAIYQGNVKAVNTDLWLFEADRLVVL
jgi:hypothetical protein